MKTWTEKTRRAWRIWRKGGFGGIKRAFSRKIVVLREKRGYQKWIREINALTETKRAEIRREIENFKRRPLISVVMPVYNVEEKWLRLCVESVTRQLYENWEFCIADDCSPSPHIRCVLEEYAAREKRIKLVFRNENGHISAASNSALELATGEFTALLDHDDELSEDALFYVAREINRFPQTEMIYSDEDMIDESGRRDRPKFKPDWSRDFFYSLNLITHLSVYRTETLRKVGGFRIGAEGSQDYDLALRVIERIPENHIRHIPKILYHWRAIKGSVALSGDEKPYAHERARDALRSHFERTGKSVIVSQTVYNLHRIQYRLPEPLPKVSLIILVDDDFQAASRAIKTFDENTDYRHCEIIAVGSEKVAVEFEKAARLSEKASLPLKFISCEKESEAENYNFAAAQTSGEILCFVDANLKPEAKDWLAEMAGFAYQAEIGAVGAKLLGGDESILHGGLIVGVNDSVGIAHHRFPRADGGSFARTQLVNNFSAVSVSCLMTRREVFESVNGFDAENLPDRFFDADFCLRLREKNYRIVFTPYAELMKVDKKRRLNLERNPTAGEKDYFVKRWREVVERDAFYNPNLSKKSAAFSIEI